MRIPRVHVETELSAGAEIALADAQSHYLKHVLRLKPGAALQLFNGHDGSEYRAVLVANGKRLRAQVEAKIANDSDSDFDCTLLQGLGRSDHTDWIIQKATELGVSRIHLFHAQRSQSRLKSKQLEKKMQHWRGVAISACEQSGRNRLPPIHFIDDFDQALSGGESGDKFLLDFDGESLAASLNAGLDSIVLLIGPEGGFNSDEIEKARQAGFRPVTLGPRVLRTETAAISAITIAQAIAGDMR